ncbi:MAG: hypothetical protein JSU03_06865 [Bacteroidetes bacterium]|nr:hypothetical protein [Bacteroidota bacterium]MBS1756983.1 hypothetical protein [Bacteroidota bacterium]
MKTKTLFIHLFTIIIIVLLSACKKDNLKPRILPLIELSSIQKAKEFIKRKMDSLGGIVQRVEVNQRMKVAFADMQGNIVEHLPLNPLTNLTSLCAGDYPDYLDLNYYYRLYQCNYGYKVGFGWLISWDNNVVLVNPSNPSNVTKGTIKVSITGNANAYNNTTTEVKITDLGTDPNNSSNNIFWVEMVSSTILPESVVNSPGATLRLGATFATDCSTLENYSIIPMGVTGFGFSTPMNSDPCSRNDLAIFQPSNTLNYLEIVGYDVLGMCTSYSTSAAPSYQQVEYSLDNGTTWNPFVNFTSPRSFIVNSSFVSRTDFATSPTIASGTYNVKIRYRNTKYLTGVTGDPLPTSSNSCFTPVWSVETYPGYIIP